MGLIGLRAVEAQGFFLKNASANILKPCATMSCTMLFPLLRRPAADGETEFRR